MGLFTGIFRQRRRRRPQDPAKQLGNAAGKVLAAVLVAGVTKMIRGRNRNV